VTLIWVQHRSGINIPTTGRRAWHIPESAVREYRAFEDHRFVGGGQQQGRIWGAEGAAKEGGRGMVNGG